jgi:hypothetical protein
MNVALGLFILSLVGAEGPRSGGAPEIAYNVRVIKIDGLDWRRTYFDRLHPVSTQAGGSVWTASHETADSLVQLDPFMTKAPCVTTTSQAVAHLSSRANRKVASGLKRVADGPVDHATRVAYAPHYQQIREGWALTIKGRKLDQGVLALVVVDDTRVSAVHQVAFSEVLASKACCEKDQTAKACCEKDQTAKACCEKDQTAKACCEKDQTAKACCEKDQTAKACCEKDQTAKACCAKELSTKVCSEHECCDEEPAVAGCVGKIASRIEVPELAHVSIGGEWLIPSGGALVLSLGVQTTADSEGKAVVSERLLVIEARAPGDTPLEKAAFEESLPEVLPSRLTAEPVGVPMPMPAMPSRCLPQALDADGSPLPLPPLPEGHATPSSLPGSAEPCASPQKFEHKHHHEATIDVASSKAGYHPAPKAKPTTESRGDSAKSKSLRAPTHAGDTSVEFEIKTAVPMIVIEKFRAATSESTVVK